MGILRGNRHSGRGPRIREDLVAGALQVAPREDLGVELSRCEDQVIGSRVAADPYTVWLQRREAERQEERPAIRWVYRYPDSAGGTGAVGAGGTREASGNRGPGTEGGLVGVS